MYIVGAVSVPPMMTVLSLSKTASVGISGHCHVRVLPIMQAGELVGNVASITVTESEPGFCGSELWVPVTVYVPASGNSTIIGFIISVVLVVFPTPIVTIPLVAPVGWAVNFSESPLRMV